MSLPLLDPRNDFVFKMLFANSLPLLTDLINAVRSTEPPIVVESVQNPRIEAEEREGKFVILDILAKDAAGYFYNVEMQMCRREQWSARSMVYLAKALATQLKSGQRYATLKPVIGIHLLNYDLFADPNQALWCFEMRDRINPAMILGREMQLNVVELAKADRLVRAGHGGIGLNGLGPAVSALTAWITWFAHWNEENIMNQIAHPPVLEAMQHLRVLSSDDETRRLAEVRERAWISERTEIEAAELRGEARTKAAALKRMIERGIPEDEAKTILEM